MKEYKIAEYLRLSLDDGEPGESHSIGGQRALINGFLENHPDIQAYSREEFSDDGFSGTNFDRPGFIAMMEKVKRGQIDCIIVKDLSRFGRNYIEVSRYIEQIFPLLGIRFIAVNDRYDSDAHTGSTAGLEIPFQNLIYDLYSKDISKKVMASKMLKMQRGECISAYAIYGYKKSPTNRNQLIVDSQAAEVVIRIFEMSCDGKTPREIALALNDEGILSPAEYKKHSGEKRVWGHNDKISIWTGAIVRRVLADKRYTGTFVARQWETKKMGSRKPSKVSPDQWITIEDAMPVIVSKEIFQQSLMMMEQRATCPKGPKNKNRTLLSGKVFCGHCGYSMGRKDSKNPYYFCKTLTYSNAYHCSGDHIQEQQLIATVLDTIQHSINLACDMKKIWKGKCSQLSEQVTAYEHELSAVREKQERQKQQRVSLYEQYRKNNWSREQYAEERLKQGREIEYLELEEERLKGALSERRGILSREDYNRFVSAFSKYTEVSKLTEELVDELIDRIEIFDATHIKIRMKYMDEFQRMSKML